MVIKLWGLPSCCRCMSTHLICTIAWHKRASMLALMTIKCNPVRPDQNVCYQGPAGSQPGNCLQLGGTGNASTETAFAAVAAGRYHSAALSKDGRIFTWGLNDYGQLGRDAATAEGVSDATCMRLYTLFLVFVCCCRAVAAVNGFSWRHACRPSQPYAVRAPDGGPRSQSIIRPLHCCVLTLCWLRESQDNQVAAAGHACIAALGADTTTTCNAALSRPLSKATDLLHQGHRTDQSRHAWDQGKHAVQCRSPAKQGQAADVRI